MESWSKESQRRSGQQAWLGGWSLTGLLAFALVAGVTAIVVTGGISEESLRLGIRATARTTLLLFVPTFVASSLRPSSASRWLLVNRRYLGVAAAVSHALHVGLLIGLGLLYPVPFLEETTALTYLVGGTVSLLMFAMALTSSDAAQRRLGASWKRLHRLGAWGVWGVFAVSYLPRAFAGAPYSLFFSAWVVGALVVRLLARWRAISRVEATAG